MKTFVAKKESVQRCWYLVDASSLRLGRLAAKIASHLRGKHKPEYTPHVDTGDYIIVINAEKIVVTGNKEKSKIYYSHTGYPGGIKEVNFGDLIKKAPERAIRLAVKGMLPRGPLGREMLKKLKVYARDVHPHAAQQPQILDFKGICNVE
ncbi:MAG: 50S ribosomal protein L13 [Porticoccaceae bacterium]|nr:50S ribosomal protein L13 [Porticoccaceae bacterium]|tara:strand:- start:1356 stop:1805 length:450 start_codon:yes stop_codon:yes gene_type:complete